MKTAITFWVKFYPYGKAVRSSIPLTINTELILWCPETFILVNAVTVQHRGGGVSVPTSYWASILGPQAGSSD